MDLHVRFSAFDTPCSPPLPVLATLRLPFAEGGVVVNADPTTRQRGPGEAVTVEVSAFEGEADGRAGAALAFGGFV